MTGPEHYQQAELLLLRGTRISGGQNLPTTYSPTPNDVAAAQVHATLALAAATALYDADFGDGLDTEYQAWRQVAATGAGGAP